LKKQVDAGEMTREAALKELGRRANSMTYDKGAGYLFGTGYDGITIMAPDPKQVGTNRMDVVTNGRKLSKELMDGVKANGSILLTYEYVKPGEEKPIRKIGYAVAVPGFDMYLGTGAYIDDLDAKLRPIVWVLGLAILGIALVSGSIAWMIGRSISRPLGQLGSRMQELAEGKLDGEIPGAGRGDEVGAMAATVQIFKDNAVRMRGLEQAEAQTQARAAAERRAAMENIASDFERSVTGIVRSVSTAAAGMQTTAQSMTSTASDASARAATVDAASQRSSDNVGTVASAAEELSSSVAEISRQVARSSEIASKAVGDAERTNATVGALSTGAREDWRGGQVDPLDRRANQSARAQRDHRSGARRRFRPRLCCGGLGGQGARQPDGEGDRGNLGPGRGDADLHQRGRGLDRRHHRNHLADERDHGLDLDRRRAAGRRHPRDRPQHSVGGGRIERDLHPYRRCHHGGSSDRQGCVRCAGECPRTRQPVRHAAQRGG
jgi:HAMP domain-containing protein